MTKEELIKLSRENLRKSKQGSLCECYDEAFIKGYELSEKRIAELEARCNELFFQVNEKIAKISELEAQIEKMKCCGNCAKNGHICVAEEMQGKLCGKNKDKWELRR